MLCLAILKPHLLTSSQLYAAVHMDFLCIEAFAYRHALHSAADKGRLSKCMPRAERLVCWNTRRFRWFLFPFRAKFLVSAD
jgi:hypothetical protein